MLFAGSLFLSSFYFSLLAVDLMLLKAAEMLPAQIGSFHAFAHDQWKSKHFPCHFAKAPSASAGKENSVFFFFLQLWLSGQALTSISLPSSPLPVPGQVTRRILGFPVPGSMLSSFFPALPREQAGVFKGFLA